jgi:hypothetical protein
LAEITGDTNKPGSKFTYGYKNRHKSKQKITEFVPGEKVAGHVTEAELTFAKDKKEWIGTDIVFEIAKKGGKIEPRFTHVGLVPTFERYRGCSGAWDGLVDRNLRSGYRLRQIGTGVRGIGLEIDQESVF